MVTNGKYVKKISALTQAHVGLPYQVVLQTVVLETRASFVVAIHAPEELANRGHCAQKYNL